MFSLMFALVFILVLGLVSFLLITKASNLSKKFLWVGGLGIFIITLASYAVLGNFFQVAQELESLEEQQVSNSLIDELEKRLADNPQDLASWVFLAQSYEVLNESKKSLASWEKAYALDPDNPEVLLNLAESLAQNNAGIYSNRAQALVATAYFMDEDNPDALWQMGVVASQHKNLPATYTYWTRLYSQLDKDGEEAINLLKLLKNLETVLDI